MELRYPAVVFAFIACGNGCGGEKLSGSVGGSSMTISSTAAQAGNGEISFVLSSTDDVCADLTANASESGSTNLAILLRSTNGSGSAQGIATGEYDFGATSGMFAMGAFEKFSDDCTDPQTASITGGSLSLTSVDDTTGQLAGELALQFGDDMLSGSFSADACGAFVGLRCPIAPVTTLRE